MQSFAIVVEISLMKKNKLVYIGGPTCSGKINLILLANTLTEIISCDSISLQGNFNRNSKALKKKLIKIKHHFINRFNS